MYVYTCIRTHDGKREKGDFKKKYRAREGLREYKPEMGIEIKTVRNPI